MNAETFTTYWRRTPRQKRLLFLGIPVIALLVIAGLILVWFGLSGIPSPLGGSLFVPEQQGEFLVVVAPFLRDDGDPSPIGGTLANNLRQQPSGDALYRVETLPRAPRDIAIPEILDNYSPSILVTGRYDGSNVDAVVELAPAAPPPPPLAAAEQGGAVLIPAANPITYEVYAPQGLPNPLDYLQSWIIGESFFWNGDYDKALAPLQRARQALPRQTPLDRRADMDRFASAINWQLGYIAGAAQGNWQAARDYFGEALRLQPDDPAAAVGYAAALTQLGDIEGANNILRAALRSTPDAWQLHFALAEVAAQQELPDAAIASYENSIRLLSGSSAPADQAALADIYTSRGYYQLSHGGPEGALADFQQAESLGRGDVYVYNNMAWAAFRTGDFDTAIRAAAEARRLAPDQPDIAFNEALLLLAASQIDAAYTAYDEAVNLTLTIPDVITRSTYFGMAYADLAELLAQRPDLESDIRQIQDYIDVANG
ncbi:MAG: tetratricopeptide repeat protein [Caldilineales bacterium]|nr:tetratricopeptide repeat protein [Caldilineales bacterium]